MLKIFQVPKHTFVLQNIKEQFSKIVFKNYFSANRAHFSQTNFQYISY